MTLVSFFPSLALSQGALRQGNCLWPFLRTLLHLHRSGNICAWKTSAPCHALTQVILSESFPFRKARFARRTLIFISFFLSILLLVDGLVLADRWSLAAGDGWGFSGLLRLKLIKSAWTKFCFCLSVHAPIIVNFSFSWPFNVSGRMMGASYTLFILTTPFKSI
jgi:hypothetical protein